MTSEDDTFNALKRIPFREIVSRIAECLRNRRSTEDIFVGTGWTKEDFTEEQINEYIKKGIKYDKTNPV